MAAPTDDQVRLIVARRTK